MSDLAMMAATEWAKANAPCSSGPISFGHDIATVYLACIATESNAGDEKAITASLAALSIRPEVLQAIALLSSLSLSPKVGERRHQTDLAGAGA